VTLGQADRKSARGELPGVAALPAAASACLHSGGEVQGGFAFKHQLVWTFATAAGGVTSLPTPGGHTMTATAAPAYLGNPANVDPEEAFVASLASCHMLTFLSIAVSKSSCSIRTRTRQSAIWRKTLTASWRSLELSYARRSRGAATEDPVQKNSIRCITLHMRIASLQTRSKRT